MTLVNPPGPPLGGEHVVLWGRGRARHRVAEFAGPLSIKSVLCGEAEWRTSEAGFLLDRDSLLVLNRGQRYSLTIEPGRGPVETLCLFFRDGYVEQAPRPITAALDDPLRTPPAGFFERLHRKDGTVSAVLQRLHRGLASQAGPGWIDDRMHEAALALCGLVGSVRHEPSRLPAVKASTRAEVHRRLLLGRRYIEDRLDAPPSLDEAARHSCLSPFHFHRLFQAAFGETPHEYGLRLRLSRAARLLRETRLPVTEVCLESGFRSLGSFSTLFRRRFGFSPRAIRKNEEAADPCGIAQ